MTIRLEPTKRPDETRRYRHDWSLFLDTDTIASQTTTSSDVTITADTIEVGSQSIIFTVAGGTANTVGTITQNIITAAGDHETEIFLIRIGLDEPVTLTDAKAYLRVLHDEEDTKIAAMIPRARKWVEAETGLLLTQRSFVERLSPSFGAIRLNFGPLVTVDEVAYVDELGADQTYVPRYWAGQDTIFPAADDSWPTTADDDAFQVSYTAGFDPSTIDERLVGAMLALIEGEFSEGYAWPERALLAASGACAQSRQMVA